MDAKRWAILILAIAAAFIVMGGGCVGLNPDNLLPTSIAPVENNQRFDGSVNVQAVVPDIRKSKAPIFHSRELSGIPNISYGKVFISGDKNEFGVDQDNRRGRVAMFHSGILRGALEKAIAQKGLFRQIVQGEADYVLDVWVIDVIRRFDVLGEGMTIDMTAIWRLTRAKDGIVIVCDFANGHGASHGIGTNAYTVGLETATREMIQKGLSKIADPARPRAAQHVAGDWPSMGSVIPEGYTKMTKNWSQLRKGLTEKEVQELIPSMPQRSCAIVFFVSNQFQGGPVEVFPNKKTETVLDPCGWITKDVDVEFLNDENKFIRIIGIRFVKGEVFEPFYPFYSLTFVNGALEHWELSK
ncbi:MAG: hypothetical protein WAU91_17195 [Desulfatitalea sp.]